MGELLRTREGEKPSLPFIYNCVRTTIDWNALSNDIPSIRTAYKQGIPLESEAALFTILTGKNTFTAINEDTRLYRSLVFGFHVKHDDPNTFVELYSSTLKCHKISKDSCLILDTFDNFIYGVKSFCCKGNTYAIKYIGNYLYLFFRKIKLSDAFGQHKIIKHGELFTLEYP